MFCEIIGRCHGARFATVLSMTHRAITMETSKFEKRRGRVRKKIEALKNGGLQADTTTSPSNSVNEGLDLFPDSPLQSGSGFQLSPDFR